MGKAAWVVRSWPRTPLLVVVSVAPHATKIINEASCLLGVGKDCSRHLGATLFAMRHASGKPSLDCVGSPSSDGASQQTDCDRLKRSIKCNRPAASFLQRQLMGTARQISRNGLVAENSFQYEDRGRDDPGQSKVRS